LVISGHLASITGSQAAPSVEVHAVIDEVDRAVTQQQIHTVRMPAAGRHDGPKNEKKAAGTGVGRRRVQVRVLAVHPRRAHEERKLKREVVDVDGVAILDCFVRRSRSREVQEYVPNRANDSVAAVAEDALAEKRGVAQTVGDVAKTRLTAVIK